MKKTDTIQTLRRRARIARYAASPKGKETRRKYVELHRDEFKGYGREYRSVNADRIRQRQAAYQLANREELQEKKHTHYLCNADRIKATELARYHSKMKDAGQKAKCRAAGREAVRRWTKTHVQLSRSRCSTWKKLNPGIVNAATGYRRAAKLQATPPWLTAQHLAMIASKYKLAARLQARDGVKRHVDHIYPLQSNQVCGLHVPWNLRVITATENCKKHNRIQY